MKTPRTKKEWEEFIPPASVTRAKRKPRSRNKADMASASGASPRQLQYLLDNIVRTDTNSPPKNQLNLF